MQKKNDIYISEDCVGISIRISISFSISISIKLVLLLIRSPIIENMTISSHHNKTATTSIVARADGQTPGTPKPILFFGKAKPCYRKHIQCGLIMPIQNYVRNLPSSKFLLRRTLQEARKVGKSTQPY